MPDLKDSGERRQFDSGAVRDRAAGKPLLNLIPAWSEFAYGWIMEAGARKYAARNWESGMPIGEYLESAQRHVAQYKAGFRDEPHLWQAFWNIGCAIHTTIMVHLGLYPETFNDLPNHITNGKVPLLGKFEQERVDKWAEKARTL